PGYRRGEGPTACRARRGTWRGQPQDRSRWRSAWIRACGDTTTIGFSTPSGRARRTPGPPGKENSLAGQVLRQEGQRWGLLRKEERTAMAAGVELHRRTGSDSPCQRLHPRVERVVI